MMQTISLDATARLLLNMGLVSLVYFQLRLIRHLKIDYFRSWVYTLIKWSILIATALLIYMYVSTLWFY